MPIWKVEVLLHQRSQNIPLYSISWTTNAQGSCSTPTNKPSARFGLTPQFSSRYHPKPELLLRGQNCLACLLKLSRINGKRGRSENTRLHFRKMSFEIFHFDPYFSSMAVLNFSTLSSLRSWAASLPVFSSLNTTCLQSSLADGRFVMSGYSSNYDSKQRKTFLST